METTLWTVEFSNGRKMYVSASTILVAIKNAVWGYNKDSSPLRIHPRDVVKARKGKE